MSDQIVNNVWGSSTPGQREFLTLPSGQTCWAVRMSVDGMLAAGLVQEADSLTQFVDRKHINKSSDGKDVTVDDLSAVIKDPKAFSSMVMLIDRAAPHIIVEPIVRLHFEDLDRPTDGGANTRLIPLDEREPGVIYTDQIGLEDKSALLQFAIGGLKSLERFREQSSTTVATVDNGTRVSVPAQRPFKHNPRRTRKS